MAKVIFLRGQSNAMGAVAIASLPVGYQQTYSNIKCWTGASWDSLDYTDDSVRYPYIQDTFGLQFSLMTKLQATWNETVYLVQYNVGGTCIDPGGASAQDWHKDTRGELYDEALSTYNEAVAALWNSGTRDITPIMIWVHGECDSINLTSSLAYDTNMIDFINKSRTNIGVSDAYMFMCRLSDNFGGVGSYPHWENTQDEQDLIIAAPEGLNHQGNIVGINTETCQLSGDGIHYDVDGYETMGQLLHDAITAVYP